MIKTKQKKISELQRVLKKLCQLFEEWKLAQNDWCLVGEWALILQNYGIRERKGVLDVYIDREKLPRKVKQERQIVPPRNSRYFNEWVNFIEETKFGLDMIPIPESSTDPRDRDSIRRDSIIYQLPNEKKIRVNTPLAEVDIHRWLFQQYTAKDVGKENIERWRQYIKNIRKVAVKKKDNEIVEACDNLLEEF